MGRSATSEFGLEGLLLEVPSRAVSMRCVSDAPGVEVKH